ncbi:MAG: aldehyde ferredoxin oxidoreductase family protein [Deltaproteobacteria bacterium]|nr:aldehyde ferredoxin oxidoreductase family protein [Deltaproteobacteria bacterium]MBW2138316.1 aldehyde ferredoxin oxidoreductase family protein [Deltaproteobacteria bacterium]
MYDGGYIGKILRVNLSAQKATEEVLPQEMAKEFIGGAGFGIKILFDELAAGVDPLGYENKLIFSVGPCTGTTVPCASRMAVTAKSPLTGAVGMAMTGGHFPVELKRAGYDALIVEGKADKPVYLWIRNGKILFRDATNLWGTRTTDCQQVIKSELQDQNIRIACIGPAGENLSRLACIVNEMRAAGRKGLGAVMGSKNLKAIAVKGTETVPVSSREKLKAARGEMAKAMKKSPVLYPEFSRTGTPSNVDNTCALGIFPAKNWTATGEFTPVEQLGVEALRTRNVGRLFCSGCPVGCSQLNLARSGPYWGYLAEGPEFETLYSFGGQTGVDELDGIITADRLADELGLDTISAGVTIGFGMELFERGILTTKDTDGLDLRFGNHEAVVKLLNLMAFREGIGDILADGVKIAAGRIGKGAERYALHVKGLELPGYDVRGAKAHGLNYATAFTGADHNRGYAFQEIFGIPIPYAVDRFVAEGKGKLTKWNQDVRMATADCPTMCVFLLDMAVAHFALENTASLMEALTGLTFSPEEIQTVGERINNLARAFNAREGFGRKEDTLPERLMQEALKGGASKGNRISKDELSRMLDEYYEARGWDVTTGIPTRRKLEELGLAYVADELNA